MLLETFLFDCQSFRTSILRKLLLHQRFYRLDEMASRPLTDLRRSRKARQLVTVGFHWLQQLAMSGPSPVEPIVQPRRRLLLDAVANLMFTEKIFT
jgi:hypothetical protein